MTRLSPAQERLWFLHNLDPTDASYHLHVTLRLRGRLNVDALERALTTIVERHPVLGSRIATVDGEPEQLPSGVTPTLEQVDRADLAEASSFAALFADAPIDLERGPMIRHALVRIGEDEHVLCVVLHHLAGDGWSLQVWRNELAELYAAFDLNKPSPLPLPSIQYSAHVARQRAAGDDEASLQYWADTLADAPTLELPTDRPRPAVRSGRGAAVAFELPAELMDRLDRFARTERVTTFMLLLAAYQVLLARQSGQRDVTVGTPILDRDDPDAESAIGYFAETLVLRGNLDADPAFREFLRATRGVVLRGFAHRTAAFQRILAEVHTPRDRSRTPLYQALFMYRRVECDPPRLGDLDVDVIDPELRRAKTDLSLEIIQDTGRTTGFLNYDYDLFERTTAELMIRRLSALLHDILKRPAARLSELTVLDEAERADVIDRWNNTAPASPAALAVDLFAAQARATPDAVAVTCGDVHVTYRELDRRADRVAALVRGRGELIGVCLRRGPDLVAALLGVWRAGAAYVPLDPEYPQDRLTLIVADSGAQVVLTEATLADRFGDRALDIATATSTDTLIEAVGDAAETWLPVTDPESAAYVLYTSGSTGRPKGVAVPHRALAAFLAAMAEILGPQPGRSWLGLTSLSFDISGLELYLPLTRGGRLVLVPDELLRDGPAVNRLIAESGVTDVQATPSGWRLLLEAGFRNTSISALVGGEALPLPLAVDLRARVGRLVNLYGPTETTIWSSFWEVPQHPSEVLIGGPIAGTRLHVLDERMDVVPLGVAGELGIAGDGVALGYLHRPGLTADRFVADPFGPPGSRLYRTGDRVRRRADGRIEFLGRTDHQVKLRGHRVELGEIETVLGGHPAVRAAAVVVRGESLIAFVTTDGSSSDLLAGVRAALPAYMVPAAVVVLDALPLTPNGKIDRRALPDVQRPTSVEFVAPRTDAERRVADVFAEVLGLAAVGANDDFFALGGHSLLAAKVIARLGSVPVRDLFDHPTVAGFAGRLLSDLAPTPIGPRPAGTPPVLSRAQERLWFLQRLDPKDASYNMFNVLRLRGPLDVDALQHALNDLAERHEPLRTWYPEVDGEPTVSVTATATTVERLDVADETQTRRLIAERTNAPFDLTNRPPLRLSLLRFADDDHVLALVLHHVAGDGWSLNLLRDDLAALYAARRDGRPADQAGLPVLPVQYADVAFHERAARTPRHTGADTKESRSTAYWRDRLADPTVLELPTDRPRPATASHRGAFHGFRLPAALAGDLELLAATHRTTLFTVLMAAFQVFLSRHTGQDDVLVGSTFAGRNRVEIESVVGYFTNTPVLRGDLADDPTFADLVKRTREDVLAAMAHDTLPFEELLAAPNVTRDPSRSPLFQTMFILHSQDQTAPTGFADLHLSFFDAGYRQAKFDLMLEAWRDPDGLLLILGYETDLFDPATIERWGERLAQLCAEAARDPLCRVGALPVLTAADELELGRTEFAADAHADPGAAATQLVPDWVAQVVVDLPEAIAVSCAETAITYAELDRRAGALAARLRMQGVSSESVVGVCLPRSIDAVVALLAIWRAGGAYLPLETDLPAERIGRLLADSGAILVVSDARVSVPWPPSTIVVDPSNPDHGTSDHDMAGQEAPGNETPGATTPGTAAYVIYTSGSTGGPKGVVVEHGALADRIAWMRDAYGLTFGERIVQFGSLTFDLSVEEIFTALSTGATLELLPDGPLSLPEVLKTPAGQDVTVLDLPTAYWHQLCEQMAEISWPRRLRLVILGGEQVHAAAVARWRARFGDTVRLINTYGPTEATIIATAAELGPNDASGRPTIGTPIAGTRIAVVDRQLRPVPPGVPGELLLGGAGLARGYLGAPELTRQRFINQRFINRGLINGDGGRYFRTGDRVRRRPNGLLEFVGRVDDQLKVRGFRVEPGEVEAELVRHPAVAAAVVAAQEGALVGYVVGTADHDELRRYLSSSLPHYLVPDRWVSVAAFPMTAAGKVDRRALVPPSESGVREQVAPRTDAEMLVAEVWQDVLQVVRVGAFDDFFELGGHSLLAVRVGARLKAAIDLNVPIRILFTHRTVAQLAVALEALLLDELADLSDDDVERLLESETR